jgi:hypothetical protein
MAGLSRRSPSVDADLSRRIPQAKADITKSVRPAQAPAAQATLELPAAQPAAAQSLSPRPRRVFFILAKALCRERP